MIKIIRRSKSTIFLKAILLSFFLYIASVATKAQQRYTVEKMVEQNKHLNIVLKKYRGDTQKMKAARFLIENLPYHFGYTGEGMDHCRKLYELRSKGIAPEKVIDSVNEVYGAFSYDKLTRVSDITMDAGYLFENIDYAFKAWREQPWGKNVSFEDFKEYVLPYRVGNEALKPWRKRVYELFNPMLDSIRRRPEAEDPKYVARVVLNILKKRRPFQFSSSFYGPSVGPDIVDWHSGNCRESSDLFIYVCRALGIPCGRDVMFLRADMNVGHDWNFVLDKNRDTYFCSVTYTSNELEAAPTYWNRKGKVYRQTFGIDKNMQQVVYSPREDIHPWFKEPLFKDVTQQYTGKLNHQIVISCDSLYEKMDNERKVYLCVASWLDWAPIGISTTSGNQVRFNNVEGGIVFRLATYEEGTIRIISDPFFLDKETGAKRYIYGSHEEEVVLTHKYRLPYTYPYRMIGGVFEGSNSRDFSSKDTLFVIKKKPQRLWDVVRLPASKTYRYVRYMGPKGSFCNVAEVGFYEEEADETPLIGEMIGTPNDDAKIKTHNYTNVFDRDPNTSFDYYLEDGGWAGLDLGMGKKINKIVYTARNNVNFVYPGNHYELFYERHGEWVSAGEMEATSDSLSFKVPKGALLYLKNHSGGKEERIFEYTNGEQQFW
ncbi:transglutaminase domain-containing protein [Niabella sp. CJ426]|uniref:transglutaminase domain-containing protein n=1 Tax=Niabella sp. CJ426 TaxID=3393740 RepID=UPI003D01FFD5